VALIFGFFLIKQKEQREDLFYQAVDSHIAEKKPVPQ
jgi:hypothetical protein